MAIEIIKLCSKCNNEAREGQRYCKDCHKEYMREYRNKRSNDEHDVPRETLG